MRFFSTFLSRATRLAFVAVFVLCLRLFAADETNAVAPVTARDFYNAGTRLLAAGKYAEAEGMLHSALSAQDERVQPRALYNLGEVRFAEGVKMLKKGPNAQSMLAQGRMVSQMSEQVLRQGRSALADNDLAGMINAYIAGHGVRKQVRAAEKALKAAMEKYGDTLRKWQRAADDFKGAAELNPADTNAANNASLVERHIARLVDSLREMQQLASMLGKQHQQLSQLLGQLRGKVPQLNGPPGADGDGDDEGGMQPEDLAGQKENPTREGDRMQIPLSPEMARHILDGLSLNSGHRLSMVDTNTSQPRVNQGRTW